MASDDALDLMLADDGGVTGGVQPDDAALNPVRLAAFCAVVERRGFTRAAEALSLTQSTVSGHIQLLEQALGSPLFDRRRHGGQLTEVGEAVYAFAVTMRREVVVLRARINDLTNGRAGVVVLGATPVLGTHVLPTMLARFHHLHPAGELRLRVLPPDAISGEVLRGRLDLGFVHERAA